MEEKRDHIITAAENQFLRFGFRKTTMEDIAKTAGIGKATLYYYFKSKEEIFAAMLEKESRLGLQHIKQTIAPIQGPVDKLRTMVLAQVNLMKERADYYTVLRQEILDILPLAQRTQEKFWQDGVNIMRNILQEGITCQIFTVADVETTAQLLVLLIQEFTTRLIIEENRPTWQADTEWFLELIVNGLQIRR